MPTAQPIAALPHLSHSTAPGSIIRLIDTKHERAATTHTHANTPACMACMAPAGTDRCLLLICPPPGVKSPSGAFNIYKRDTIAMQPEYNRTYNRSLNRYTTSKQPRQTTITQ